MTMTDLRCSVQIALPCRCAVDNQSTGQNETQANAVRGDRKDHNPTQMWVLVVFNYNDVPKRAALTVIYRYKCVAR